MDIDDQLEICHHVLHLGTLEEGVPRVDHIRQVALAQCLFQGPGLRIRAVKDCEILIPGVILLHPCDYLRSYPERLLLFRETAQDPDLLSGPTYRHAVLRDPVFILGYQGIGSIYDIRS